MTKYKRGDIIRLKIYINAVGVILGVANYSNVLTYKVRWLDFHNEGVVHPVADIDGNNNVLHITDIFKEEI